MSGHPLGEEACAAPDRAGRRLGSPANNEGIQLVWGAGTEVLPDCYWRSLLTVIPTRRNA